MAILCSSSGCKTLGYGKHETVARQSSRKVGRLKCFRQLRSVCRSCYRSNRGCIQRQWFCKPVAHGIIPDDIHKRRACIYSNSYRLNEDRFPLSPMWDSKYPRATHEKWWQWIYFPLVEPEDDQCPLGIRKRCCQGIVANKQNFLDSLLHPSSRDTLLRQKKLRDREYLQRWWYPS